MTDLFVFKSKQSGLPYSALTDKLYGPALVHGINHTIERIQAETKAKLPAQLTLRTAASKRLINSLISIDRDDFASSRQKRYRGRVGIKAPVGASEGVRRFAPRITRFEFGGTETSRDGKPLYIPTRTLRATPAGTIRRDMYPKALGVLESRTIEGGEAGRGIKRTKRGKIIIRGARGTYAVDPRFHTDAPHGTLGVWQRRKGGSGDIASRLKRDRAIFKLWNYVRQIRYPRRFTFREDSARIASTNLPERIKHYMRTQGERAIINAAAR